VVDVVGIGVVLVVTFVNAEVAVVTDAAVEFTLGCEFENLSTLF
jgi:hypothetical protein